MAQEKNATIYDIAREADCSPATVSLALNGSKRIKQETRENVLEVSRRLGYRPSYFGKSLVTQKANTIGLAIPDVDNPLFSLMMEGVEDYLKDTGYHLLLDVTRNDEERELAVLDRLYEKKVDGLIVSPMYEASLTKCVLESGLDTNCVVYCGLPPTPPAKIRYVECNSRVGSFKGVEHLAGKGRRRIAFFAPVVVQRQGQRRLSGYREALEAHGLAFDSQLVFHCRQNFHDIYETACRMFREQKPDGVFCLYDFAAIPIMRAAADLHLDIPRDVSIVGYDNIEITQYFQQSLTTVETYSKRQGAIAAEMLVRSLRGENSVEQSVILEPVLIERESS